MPRAVYLHIPFCEYICHYCDFNKYFLQGQPVDDYLKAMRSEMEETIKRFPAKEIETIFVGGGTPTALDHSQTAYFMESIIKFLNPKSDNIEFTVEANPGNLDRDKLAILKDAGVNRLSIGVQSFDKGLLKEIGRTHDREDVYKTIMEARNIGIDNLSIDLMYRLPGQTSQQLKASLNEAMSLPVQHVSIYSLQIEPRTIFYNRMRKGELPIPGEDEEADMFQLLLDMLAANGFRRYEISNFAKSGFESRHNRVYWQNDEYYGIGAGAHSYIGGVRRVNAGWTKKYIRLIHERGHAFVEESPVTKREQMEEEMFLGLRKAEGISIEGFKDRYGLSLNEVFGRPIEHLLSRQLLKQSGGNLMLTEKGLFLGNEVFQQFIE